MNRMDALATVRLYHRETKHHFHRYAPSLGIMDWANEPDPFRRYAGAPVTELPLLSPEELSESPPYDCLYRPGAIQSEPVNLASLSRLFHYALAITAWKEYRGSRWSLRSNPSSGDLHPTEGYLLVGALPDLLPFPALHHYAPRDHVLERRADWSAERFEELFRDFPGGSLLVGLASVHWREAWKYGERAYRYCHHDLGHAIGTVRLAAAALGWRAVVLHGTSDAAVGKLLGLDRTDDFAGCEAEHPGALVLIWPSQADPPAGLPLFFDIDALARLGPVRWHGRANRLSPQEAVPWKSIDQVAHAARKPHTDAIAAPGVASSPERARSASQRHAGGTGRPSGPSAGRIIIQRRSALAFDGATSLPARSFFTMLERVMPCAERSLVDRPAPWDVLPWESVIDLALFVHRVDGLPPGLYALVRGPERLDRLRRATRPQFVWRAPSDAPEDLPFYHLQQGDFRRVAIEVSCEQEIAGLGAFSLGMIADFESALARFGAWFYPRLYWESGLIGQVLYLEAEAAGVRATGIGCFFDDPMHEVLGLGGTAFQDLYHFAVGGPIEDTRLTTLPAYSRRRDSA
jgi:SagB-type dehydrogenase family enzyme